jgi:hypothetical protein
MIGKSAGSVAAALAIGLTLAAASPALAAPPRINGTTPFGAQRAVETEVTINGVNLAANPQLIAPFGFALTPPPAPNADAANWKLKITVAPETPVGVYPIRVKTDGGLSNPFLFSVGQLPQVAEKEDNSAFETAQPIPSLAVVEGQTAANDVDFFKFPGKKGQRILIDAQCARIGSGVDPTIRLTTAARVYVASADDTPGLLTDARLTTVLPEDTDYVIEISDSRYQGAGRPVYRLVVGPVPMADEVYPLGGRQGETIGLELRGGTLTDLRVAATTINARPDSETTPFRVSNQMIGLAPPGAPVLDLESLTPLSVSPFVEIREPADPAAAPVKGVAPVVFNGRIDPAGDLDKFSMPVAAGQKYRIEVDASEFGSALDGVLQVLGANNAVLATADDTTIPPTGKKGKAAGIVTPDPSLDFTVPAGQTEITLALKDLEGRGGIGFPYRITVVPIVADFELALNDSEVSLPKGGNAVVGVTVTRKGYTGPITLSIPNPPAGLTIRPGTIADGQTIGSFSISAAPDAALGVVSLNVVGEGKGPAGPFSIPAQKVIVFAQQATLPTNTVTQLGLAAAPAAPLPLKLDAPATVEVVHGLGGPIPIKVERAATPDADAIALVVSAPPATAPALPFPTGITVPNVNIAAKAKEAVVTVNVAPEAPLGVLTIGLIAKGKVANVDETLGVPAVTLTIVRPTELTLAAPNLEIKAGATVELKGKIVRKGAFKEPVTIKLNALPAGLKADPVTVAPGATDFTLKVVADPTAAAAMASASVAMAFQINKKDYPAPPTPLPVKVLPAK